MEIYPIVQKKWSISRIKIKDLVSAVFLMASRAENYGCGIMFFPEAGALPLRYIFERGIASRKDYAVKIFSSKVTSSTKSPLSKQICAILSPAERRQRLTRNQIADFKEAVDMLPSSSKKVLTKALDIGRLEYLNLSEIIGIINDIGLYVPSEDKSNWVKAGIIPKTHDYNNYSPESKSFEEFQNFRKKIITYSIERISDITHDTRSLFNIILSNTGFARAVHQDTIYVMDEAISRGRTLNILEIIFKAFDKNTDWKIGVLFCPVNIKSHGNVDFILSNSHTPPFSNRFDLIGNIVVESDIAFARYSTDDMLLRKKKHIKTANEKQLKEYFKCIRQFTRRTFFSLLKPNIIDEDDLVRLLHFVFVCNNMDIIKRCIDLNPVKIRGIIEEVSFYINMPHPFDPMPIRKEYKDAMLQAIGYFKKLPLKSSIRREFQELKKNFYTIRKYYEANELKCWSERHHSAKSKIDSFL